SSYRSLFLYHPILLRDLHSFPTRRSSDLSPFQLGMTMLTPDVTLMAVLNRGLRVSHAFEGQQAAVASDRHQRVALFDYGDDRKRSEEHTSELQSPDHLVCRLLLEKKNK